MKMCPFCREEIRDDAIKCRYCSSSLLPVQLDLEPASQQPFSGGRGRVTYVLDKDLIRFAKFALATLAIFVAIGAYFYGFKVEQAADKVRDSAEKMSELQRDALKTHDEIQKAKDQVASDIEGLLAKARQAFDNSNQQIREAQNQIASAEQNAARIAREAAAASRRAQSAAERATRLVPLTEQALESINTNRQRVDTLTAYIIEKARDSSSTDSAAFVPEHLYTEAEVFSLVKDDAQKAFDYFRRHGFMSQFQVKILGSNHDRNYENAFWDGSALQFGMGVVNSELFGPYDSTLVYYVSAHAFLHLPPQGESGSILTSICDVLAVVIRGDGWTIGRVRQPTGHGVLRSLQSPGTAFNNTRLGQDPQPDHMSHFVVTDEDNGGVHLNSGILNKAAYLISEGGTFHGITVGQGLGRVKLGELYMEVVRQLSNSPLNFQGFRDLLLSTARKMYGAHDSETVRQALEAVGL